MGRYYDGDIDGKFWFAVQSSNDADYFGVEGRYYELEYYFNEDNLPDIKKGITDCEETLGCMKELLDLFFEHNNSYTDKMIAEAFYIEVESVKHYLLWYARLRLGKKILECVEANKDCSFTAGL